MSRELLETALPLYCQILELIDSAILYSLHQWVLPSTEM